MEFSMIEISRMGREAEKVAGLWAGHGVMYRLLMPHFLSPGCVSGSRGAERPDCCCSLKCVSPAIWGNVGFTCNLSFRSFSPACKHKLRFNGYVSQFGEGPASPSHSLWWDCAVPVQKSWWKTHSDNVSDPPGLLQASRCEASCPGWGKPLLISPRPENSIVCGFKPPSGSGLK